jgi:hypothetical protein
MNGFERVLNIGEPIINNLTQEAKEYVNNPGLTVSIHGLAEKSIRNG